MHATGTVDVPCADLLPHGGDRDTITARRVAWEVGVLMVRRSALTVLRLVTGDSLRISLRPVTLPTSRRYRQSSTWPDLVRQIEFPFRSWIVGERNRERPNGRQVHL